LGYLSKITDKLAAVLGVVMGVLLIFWMSLSGQTVFHSYLAIVFGTILIFGAGFLIGMIGELQKKRRMTGDKR
jgi:SSS family solute:Na+ symporter